MDSILTSIKKQLGIEEEYEHFDPELIMHINTVLMTLTQIGVGPSDGFAVTDKNDKWTDFVHDTPSFKVDWIKTYVGLQVKMIFDTPTGSALDSYTRRISELEWRLNHAVDCSG